MQFMFQQANSFNQPLASWETSNVSNMNRMFWANTAFNRDLSNWNIAKVTDFGSMFQGASAFDRGLCAWGPQIDAAGTNPIFTDMFAGASRCPTTMSPDLANMPTGPFCYLCVMTVPPTFITLP